MPTDKEKREIAQKLREYVDLPDDWWQETRAEFYIEKCVFGNVDRHSEAELFTRLADLIDPPARCPHYMHPCCRTDAGGDYIDRDALLELSYEMEDLVKAWGGKYPTNRVAAYARRIREALGVTRDEK